MCLIVSLFVKFLNKFYVSAHSEFVCNIIFLLGSLSYGVDLCVLSMCNHSIVDYGSFGLWAALMAGGQIILPRGHSPRNTSDMMWWERAEMSNVEYVDINQLNISSS